MSTKKYDVVGLGACGIDLSVKIARFPGTNGKITSDQLTMSAGGVTANNLTQCAKLGLKVAWLGALGDDAWGKYLIEEFKKVKVLTPVPLFLKKNTQQFWIFVTPRKDYAMVGIPGASRELTAGIVRDKFRHVIKQARHFHTEIAIIPLVAVLAGIKIAHENGVKTLIDVDGDPYYLIDKEKIGTKKELREIISLTDVIKLSSSAARGLTKEKRISKNMIKKILEMGPQLVVITEKAKGCLIGNRQKTIFVKGIKIKAKNTVGAGDAFMGGLSYGILKNWNISIIGKFANACGAFKSKQEGTRSSGTKNQISSLLKKDFYITRNNYNC